MRAAKGMLPIALFMAACALRLGASTVVRVNIDGPIHPVTSDLLDSAIRQAQARQAEFLLIRLNTPGGLLETTREMVEKIVASPVPVVAFVEPSGARAASAGFFLLQAADIAAMAPGTNAGASSPVLLGKSMDPVMRSKVENDTAALLRSVTTRRHRNSELAEKAVREAKAFTETESLAHRLIDLIAIDEPALLGSLQGKQVTRFQGTTQTIQSAGAQIVDVELNWRQRLLRLIADPNIGLILLVLGVLGLYIEFHMPGVIFPGVAGAVSAILGLFSLALLPINWAGVALLLLALACFILEAKFTSHGVLGTSGGVCLVLGAIILIHAPPEMRIRPGTAIALATPFTIITVFLMSLAVKARRTPVQTGASGMLGETGVAQSPLAPRGQVFIHGEYWQAVASATVQQGEPVRVKEVRGLELIVEPYASSDAVDGEAAKTVKES